MEDPLLIRHQRLVDTYDTQNDYTVDAYIRHRSGIMSAQLYWTSDTAQGFASLPMTALGGDMWTASIPAQMALTDVFYYIEANANSGKVQVRPLVAPEGWWKFRVLDINTAMNETSGPEIAEVFPNPTRSLVMVSLGLTGPGPVDVYLTDALGRKVMVLNDGTLPADRRLFADLSALEPGAYLIVASTASGRAVKRVVRQ